MLSGVMLLTHLGENHAAARLQWSIEATYRDGQCLTGDVGGTGSTGEFTDAVLRQLRR